MLGDLTWISEHEVVLAHDGLSDSMDRADLQVYLRVLADAVRFWIGRKRREHSLLVVFPDAHEFQVRSLLTSTGNQSA
jgi:hypothetical protein